jgi:uncharacterized membrane protein
VVRRTTLGLPRVDPLRKKSEKFAGPYLLLRVVITLYLAFVITNLAIGNEESVPGGDLVLGSMGIVFVILGAAMRKFEPNWFAGIHTPWTLTSKRSWEKTHRLGGRVFIASGLGTMVG